ncbi:MAG TPA: Fic family protein [Pseudolabrys sp.]|nr:Fic family protein [Pseudolabrys sp.]
MELRSLAITPELLGLIADVDEFKGTWRAMQAMAPERLAALRHIATIESIGSSTRIEGATLSDREVEQFLAHLDTAAFTSRDEEEVAGYAEVMDEVFRSHDHIPITENHIKQLHGMLLRHSGKDERHRGQYKTLPNNVEAFDAQGRSVGVIFKTVSPFDTPFRMQELVAWTRDAFENKQLHPLLVIGIFVVVFLQIHPFQDGNGRLSRVLTTLLLLKAGYTYVPYSSLESVIEHNKDGYYLALRRTQTTLESPDPDWLPWMRFFLSALKAQKDRLASKIAATDRLTGWPPEAVRIVEHVRQAGRITTAEAQALTRKPRPTVKRRLTELTRAGLLNRYGKGRGSWYGLP